jgi:hypothetical protein
MRVYLPWKSNQTGVTGGLLFGHRHIALPALGRSRVSPLSVGARGRPSGAVVVVVVVELVVIVLVDSDRTSGRQTVPSAKPREAS